MNTIRKTLACLCFGILIVNFGLCQDIEQKVNDLNSRLNQDPLKITGSFNAFGQYYQAFGIDHRALPFTGRLMAAINFDFLGINAPFSLAYSNGGVVFNKRLPTYSFVGISPSYKWVKLLIGNRTMDFGKYSFSNHSFTGGGFELTPGNWDVSAFYGRLRRARAEDFAGFQNVESYYRRMGFGGKVGYDNGKDKVFLSVFKAWDIENSIPDVNNTLDLYPSENVIVSSEITKHLSDRLNFEINYSRSGFSDNRRLTETSTGIRPSNYFGLLTKNISTRNNNAFEAKFNIKISKGTLDFAYERIDPSYRTMGALFFNNDLENISSGLKLKLFKSKWVLFARAGLQRNNLNGDQANDYKRFVGSLRSNLIVNKKLTLTTSLSNFNNVNRRTSILNPGSPIILTDLVLNNQDANLGFSYLISNDNSRTSSLQGSASYAVGNTINNDLVDFDQQTKSRNINLFYTLAFKPKQWVVSVNSAFQENFFGHTISSFTTIGASASKKLLDQKLNLGLQVNYALNRQSLSKVSIANGNLYTALFQCSYALNKNSAIAFNSMLIHNSVENEVNNINSFSEWRNALNFQYRFNPKKK